jgi:hypothetical protein
VTKLRSLINTAALAVAISVALPTLADDTAVVANGGHHYVYYRDHGIYYAPETGTYFWREHGKWQSGASLPQDQRSYASGNGVDIELDTERPYERNDYVIARYGTAPRVPDASDRYVGGRTLSNGGTRSNADVGRYRYLYYSDRGVLLRTTDTNLLLAERWPLAIWHHGAARIGTVRAQWRGRDRARYGAAI